MAKLGKSRFIINSIVFSLLLICLNSTFASLPDHINDLFQAVRSGDLKNVKHLVCQHPSSVHAKNNRGETPLFVASYNGNIEMVNFLLEAGSDLECENKFGQTPLFASIESNKYDVSKCLITFGANVNHSSIFFGTPLHRASFHNNSEIVSELLHHGASTQLRNRTQKTPLHEAVRMGAVECTILLLENNADANVPDIKGRTPLHYSILAGTDLHDHNYSDTLVILLIHYGANPSSVDSSGASPLVYAVETGKMNICKNLLENGSDPGIITSRFYRTLLHSASIKGYSGIAGMLIQYGVDPYKEDVLGNSALYYAVKHGNEEIAKMLSNNKIDPEILENGKTYLDLTLTDHEAYLWKMNHRGWALKTREYLIVFDYEENGNPPEKPSLSNGWLSAEEIQESKVIACYSAYHGKQENIDAFHEFEDYLPDITYFHYKKDEWEGGEHTLRLDGNDSYVMGNLELDTYETMDSYGMGSLGYYIEANEIRVFYANFITENREIFIRSIDKIEPPEEGISLAIIDIPASNDTFFTSYIIKRFKPQSVILYSRQNNYDALDEHKNTLLQEMPGLHVVRFTDPGDRKYFSDKSYTKNQ